MNPAMAKASSPAHGRRSEDMEGSSLCLGRDVLMAMNKNLFSYRLILSRTMHISLSKKIKLLHTGLKVRRRF
jgi:hypothetical protein